MRKLMLALLVVPLVALGDIIGKVVSVTDGDTIKVLDGTSTQHKVRLTGIDAPERVNPMAMPPESIWLL